MRLVEIDRRPWQEGRFARNPATSTPARRPGLLRRTSHVDMSRLGASMQDGVLLAGSARDQRTTDGQPPSPDVLGQAAVRAVLGANRVLRELDVRSDAVAERVAPLLGLTVASGFRAAVDACVPDERDAKSPLYLLLDDLPVAALIAGYADLFLRAPDEPETDERRAAQSLKSDICAGWATEATMMQEIRRTGKIPTPHGPPAPRLESDDDPHAWHEIPELAAGAMRRRRRIDVLPGDTIEIEAMFRDSHVDAEGKETVVHEYSLAATADPETHEILSCEATPRVLPWPECPRAMASAGRLVGQPLGDLRHFVRANLLGTSTCTHLNDLLRSLADVEPLLRHAR